LTYMFLVGLGAYVIPIFGSIQSTRTSADNHESMEVQLVSMPGLDDLSKGWKEIAEDENISASRSIKYTSGNLDLPAEQQKSLEGGVEEQVKPIQLMNEYRNYISIETMRRIVNNMFRENRQYTFIVIYQTECIRVNILIMVPIRLHIHANCVDALDNGDRYSGRV